MLGYRQTGSNGDSGAAFAFQLENTVGKTHLSLEFLLQSLDITSTRTVSLVIYYGFGDLPARFTEAAAVGTLTTGGSTFSNNTVTANLAAH